MQGHDFAHDIIVIGASAGGVEALTTIVAGLPADLPAAVFVVLHMSAEAPSLLPAILSRCGPLPAVPATNGEPIKCGRIYVAVPDYHLLVEQGNVRVVRGPKENRSRPAVDPLFRTAARAYGSRVIGVVLTGALDDGTAGLYAIKQMGGIAVVQDPRDALIPSMPASAIDYVAVDHVVPLREIAPLLTALVREPATPKGALQVPEDAKKEIDLESRMAAMDSSALQSTDRPGKLSGFTCPECNGPLWEVRDGQLLRFRCRVGHAFTGETILAGQAEAVEDALWMAVNILEESAQVADQLAHEARERNSPRVAARLEERASAKRRNVEVLRTVLLNGSVRAVEDVEQMNVQEAEGGKAASE